MKETIGGVSEQVILYAKNWFKDDFKDPGDDINNLSRIISKLCYLPGVSERDVMRCVIRAYTECVGFMNSALMPQVLEEIMGVRWLGFERKPIQVLLGQLSILPDDLVDPGNKVQMSPVKAQEPEKITYPSAADDLHAACIIK